MPRGTYLCQVLLWLYNQRPVPVAENSPSSCCCPGRGREGSSSDTHPHHTHAKHTRHHHHHTRRMRVRQCECECHTRASQREHLELSSMIIQGSPAQQSLKDSLHALQSVCPKFDARTCHCSVREPPFGGKYASSSRNGPSLPFSSLA